MATCADLARRLLDAARDDELMASSLLPVKGVTDTGIGFHAHQAVEKAIKAVLSAKQTKFPFTHDLKRLAEFAAESGIDLPATLNGVERLTPFARDERYGSGNPPQPRPRPSAEMGRRGGRLGAKHRRGASRRRASPDVGRPGPNHDWITRTRSAWAAWDEATRCSRRH